MYMYAMNIQNDVIGLRFVDLIVITVHDRFWNVGQANCILKYFENMMTDHSDSTIFQKMVDFTIISFFCLV
jgi:hypothetical protein